MTAFGADKRFFFERLANLNLKSLSLTQIRYRLLAIKKFF